MSINIRELYGRRHVPDGLEGLVGAGGSCTSITSPGERHECRCGGEAIGSGRKKKEKGRTEGGEVCVYDIFVDVVADAADEDGFLGLGAFLHGLFSH